MPIINLIVVNFIYHIPYAFPIAGLLALILGAIYILLLKARRPAGSPRRRNIFIAAKLYLGFALVAGINIIAEGWHWYELSYLVFPTIVSIVVFRSQSLKKVSAQSNG